MRLCIHLTFLHLFVFNIFHPIFQNKSLCRGPFRTQTSTGLIISSFPFRAEFRRLLSVTVSEAALRRCSIIKFTKICKVQRKTPVTESLFDTIFFRVIKRQKVRAKYTFANRYSVTKRANLYCKRASFKFSISSLI